MLSDKSKLKPLELSSDFRYALDMMENSGQSLFITGRAGTGKSTLLSLFRNTSRKKVVVLAPTGIAALNVKGQTIHSFFAFPPKVIQKDDIKRYRTRKKKFKAIDVIVIDEVSMVRADLLDGIDMFLRLNRENPSPFGGVQMIFFGDLFQLPPVVSRTAEKQYFSTYYHTPYFFSSKVIEDRFPVEMIELDKVYRQDEKHFVRLLDAIRTHTLDHEDLDDLNLRYQPDFAGQSSYITLCSVNAIADQINNSNLRELNTTEFNYQADLSGDFKLRLFPTQQFLTLKEGAQVMLLRNDPQKRFVNGSIASVIYLNEETVKLRLLGGDHDGEEIDLDKIEWEMLKYEYNEKSEKKLETKVIGTFKQYPLKMAWAITIHKSQGKTFDRVIIDLGRGAFEYGQSYVALSRCRTLSGIVLKRPLKYTDVIVDERIVDFYDGMRRYLPGA
jgi:ATP-dependent DNA helicase PIF1